VAEDDIQPDFLNPDGFDSVSILVLFAFATGSEGIVGAAAGGLAILIPAAAAIFLNSFSSRLLSFSFRLSTSSFGMRTLACMSLKRALWWCA
jgi:hypothetical protein